MDHHYARVFPGHCDGYYLNFINIWNNRLFPLVFISDKDNQLMSFGILSFFSQWSADYGGVMAAITISLIPTVLIYIFLQEKVEKE